MSRLRKRQASGGADDAFDRVLARIQRALLPHTAAVTRHVELPDRHTGSPVAIEASIEVSIGDKKGLVVVAWLGPERRPTEAWLDEVRLKKELVGADTALALTMNAATPQVKAAAARLGVRLASARRLTDDQIRGVIELA